MPRALRMTPIAGLFVTAAFCCRLGDPVCDESEPVCSATGAATIVRSVTVTTAPPLSVDVKMCIDVID
jgi:hypothetical protein